MGDDGSSSSAISKMFPFSNVFFAIFPPPNSFKQKIQQCLNSNSRRNCLSVKDIDISLWKETDMNQR